MCDIAVFPPLGPTTETSEKERSKRSVFPESSPEGTSEQFTAPRVVFKADERYVVVKFLCQANSMIPTTKSVDLAKGG